MLKRNLKLYFIFFVVIYSIIMLFLSLWFYIPDYYIIYKNNGIEAVFGKIFVSVFKDYNVFLVFLLEVMLFAILMTTLVGVAIYKKSEKIYLGLLFIVMNIISLIIVLFVFICGLSINQSYQNFIVKGINIFYNKLPSMEDSDIGKINIFSLLTIILFVYIPSYFIFKKIWILFTTNKKARDIVLNVDQNGSIANKNILFAHATFILAFLTVIPAISSTFGLQGELKNEVETFISMCLITIIVPFFYLLYSQSE